MDYKCLINQYNSIYIHGKTYSGKTTSVLAFLKSNKYDYTYTYLQKIKNESDFNILLNGQNILYLLNKCEKNKKIIVIDNIDYLHNNDKKILGIIIKFLKHKENKIKYKNITFIFVGINNYDKKVLELMNVTMKVIQFNPNHILDYDKAIKEVVGNFLEYTIDYNNIVCEKTIISLCYHENIINNIHTINHYETFLENFCAGDYYDRLSFQKQLWQFNEMTFYLKVLYNYLLLKKNNITKKEKKEVIFTKILTKYSNEYSNLNFINNMCNRINCQKEELYNAFIVNKNEPIYKKYKENITNIEEKRIIKLLS